VRTSHASAIPVARLFGLIVGIFCSGISCGILNAMLYRAADMGADGIVLSPPPNPAEDVTGSKGEVQVDVRVGWAALIGSRDQRAYRAQAIRFGP